MENVTEGAKKRRSSRKKKTYSERCEALLDVSFDGVRRLESLGELSEKLGGMLGAALEDTEQFKRYIVVEKGKTADGDSFAENVEKVYEKIDFKSMKEAASAISAIADSVRNVYSVPGFKELSGGAAPASSPAAQGITVSFGSGEEFAV